MIVRVRSSGKAVAPGVNARPGLAECEREGSSSASRSVGGEARKARTGKVREFEEARAMRRPGAIERERQTSTPGRARETRC
jgi:hypothetical protein